MSLFDDIVQRGFDELAKAKKRREQSQQDIMDGEFVELSDVPNLDEEDVIDTDGKFIEPDEPEVPVGQDEIPVPEEKKPEEPDTKPSEPDTRKDDVPKGRVDAVTLDLVFKDDVPDEEKAAMQMIAGMPESTLDEVTAKALTFMKYKNPLGMVDKPDELGIWASHLVLQQFHESYDKDGGTAWKVNELEHPLIGWSDVVEKSLKDGSYDSELVHAVDMEKFGLQGDAKGVVFPEERKPPERPDFVKGKKWNEKIYHKTKEGKDFVFLDGLRKTLSEEQSKELHDYLTEKELFEKGMSGTQPDNSKKPKDDENTKKDEQPDNEKKPEESHTEPDKQPEEPSSKGPNVISDDHDWADGYSDLFGGFRTMDDNGMISYEGILGKFSYDPRDFQLQVIQVEPDEFGNPATSYPVLKYVGSEVEGKNIKIPDGLEDASFMFDGNTELQSIPKMPSSLKIGFGMFKDCANLESGHAFTLPSKMTDAQFMFSGCTKMVVGPTVIPGNVKDATGMFANCKSLGNTPLIMHGVECCDSMFANCESLTKKPKLPQTVQYADYATYGCDGIDAVEKQAAKDATKKQEKKFEKAMDKKSFGQRLGSLLSACMQVHAMQKAGNNMFHAMFMTHQMRKAGAFTRDIAGGWAALYKADRSGFNQFMMMSSRNNAAKRQQADGNRKSNQSQAFADTNSDLKQSSKRDRTMYENGARAMSSHYFEKVAKHGYPAQKTNREAVVMDAKELESLMEARQETGTLNAKAKTYYAKKALEMVSNQSAYYKGAASQLKPENKLGMEGLSKVTDTNMKVLADKIQSLQSTYQFMNERQFKSVCQMMEQTSYGKTDAYKTFKESIAQDMKSRAQFSAMEQKDNLNAYRRRDYRQNHGIRVDEAEKRFGFMDNQSVHAQKSDETQFDA